MKTIKILLAGLFILPITTFAQLKVDTSGRTIFGATAKTYTNGISIYDNGGTTPLRIFRDTDNNVYFTRGTDLGTGFRMNSAGRIGIGKYSDGRSYDGGIISIHSSNRVGLYVRGEDTYDYGDVLKVTVTRPLSNSIACWYDSRLNFYVRGNGDVYGKSYNTASDISLKKNIETIENPLDKVLSLRGVSFEYKDSEVKKISVREESLIDMTTENSDEEFVKLDKAIVSQLEAEQLRKRIGFIAQEVEEIVPEVVRTTETGIKTVAYQELVGLLVEAIKEQQSQIDRLTAMVENPSEMRSALDLEAEVKTWEAELRANVPNPFKEETRISYVLPEDVKTAVLYIYDMQGKQLKSERITDRGEGFVIIRGSELSAGMYIYTLVADGKEVGTHRMILTK